MTPIHTQHPDRQRAFLINAEGFAAGIVTELGRHQIDVPLLTCRGNGSEQEFRKVLDAQAICIFSTEARFGILPPQLSTPIEPARAEDLRRLEPSAGRVLQMLDRMNHSGYSVAELRRIYVGMVGLWRTLLSKLSPSVVVFCGGTPSMGFDHVLYDLARGDNIPCVIFRFTHIEGRVMPTYSIEESPGPTEKELDELRLAPEENVTFASPKNDARYRSIMDLKTIRRKLSRTGVVRPLLGLRQLSRIAPTPWFLFEPRPRHFELRWKNFLGRLECRRCLLRYETISSPPDYSIPYVYFPLSVEPEENTVPLGGLFSDQLHAIAVLSAGLPAGWKIYVKEHAGQFNAKFLISKARNQHFYRRLSEIPNVICAPLEEPSPTLTANARAVAVISGTTGWEGLQISKPAIVFGNPWYAKAPGVLRVRSLDECRAALSAVARGDERVSSDRLSKYLKLMTDHHTRKLIYLTAGLATTDTSVAEHVREFVDVIRQTIKEGSTHAQA